MGFQPKTQVQLSNIKFSSIRVVSPEEIQFTLAEATEMTGKKIQVVNPDGSQDVYYSYLRGVPVGQSKQALLASALPIFSAMKYTQAVFGPMAPPPGQFTGLALQNPGLEPATVTVSLYSPQNVLLGTSTFVLDSGDPDDARDIRTGARRRSGQQQLRGGELQPSGTSLRVPGQ